MLSPTWTKIAGGCKSIFKEDFVKDWFDFLPAENIWASLVINSWTSRRGSANRATADRATANRPATERRSRLHRSRECLSRLKPVSTATENWRSAVSSKDVVELRFSWCQTAEGQRHKEKRTDHDGWTQNTEWFATTKHPLIYHSDPLLWFSCFLRTHLRTTLRHL